MAIHRKPKLEAINFQPIPRKVCPFCGKPSYSASGEHPQCSVTRGDAVIRAKLAKRAAAQKP